MHPGSCFKEHALAIWSTTSWVDLAASCPRKTVKISVLAWWLSWLEHHPLHQKAEGLLSSQHAYIPMLCVQGTVGEQTEGNQSMFLSLSLSSLSLLLSKINKYVLWWGFFFKKSKLFRQELYFLFIYNWDLSCVNTVITFLIASLETKVMMSQM